MDTDIITIITTTTLDAGILDFQEEDITIADVVSAHIDIMGQVEMLLLTSNHVSI